MKPVASFVAPAGRRGSRITLAVRNASGWPVITNLRADPYERTSSQSGMYIRWYGDNIWLFVPVQQKLKAFLTRLPDYPFQRGGSLNAARSPAEKFTESCPWKCNSHSRDYTPA